MQPMIADPFDASVAVQHRSHVPVHVIGHARSGTSLFATMLRKYLRIAFGTESQFIVRFYTRLPNYGDLNQAHNRDRLVRDIYRERWFVRCRKFGFATTPEEILADVAVPTYAGILDAVFRQLAKHLNMPRWGDKTPEYVHALPTLYKLFPNARYIHVVRDGRDVALSGFDVPFGEKNVYCAAKGWCSAMSRVNQFARMLPPEQFLEVRYEDFVEHPTDVFAKLIRFLEIDDADGNLLSFVRERIGADIVRGNSEKWRQRLSPAQVRRFDAVAYAQLVRCGYESSLEREARPNVLSRALWHFDNRFRKLCRQDYWQDNLYKLRLKFRGIS